MKKLVAAVIACLLAATVAAVAPSINNANRGNDWELSYHGNDWE